MRTAMMMLSGSAELVQTACPSGMPSASVSLTSLLRRRGSASARRKRSALQSLQLSPPSVERVTPETSSTAKISPRRRECGANRMRPDNEHGHLSFKLVLRANLVRIPSACGWYLLTVVRGPILVATISASSDAVFFSTAGTSEFFILSQSGERLGGATHTARFYCHNGSTCCWSQGRCALSN